jgi:hypothetical protein
MEDFELSRLGKSVEFGTIFKDRRSQPNESSIFCVAQIQKEN